MHSGNSEPGDIREAQQWFRSLGDSLAAALTPPGEVEERLRRIIRGNQAGAEPGRAGRPQVTGVIAIDGSSGTGKTTVSRRLATDFGLRYLDTGATYRAMTWWMLEHGIDVTQPGMIAATCRRPVIEVSTDPRQPRITVDGVDVTVPIRGPEVSRAVSAVAAVPEVRRRLVALQRAVIAGPPAAGTGRPAGIVAEGRDVGTVVAPHAAVKVYLIAAADVRAARRAAEMPPGAAAGRHLRALDRMPPDVGEAVAAMVDVTELTVDDAVDLISDLIVRANEDSPAGRPARELRSEKPQVLVMAA